MRPLERPRLKRKDQRFLNTVLNDSGMVQHTDQRQTLAMRWSGAKAGNFLKKLVWFGFGAIHGRLIATRCEECEVGSARTSVDYN